MPRGYRCIVLAAVGWLILSAAQPPQPNRKQPPEDAQAEISNSLKNIAASLREANKPSDLDQKCDPPENKRTSDLCAQWKAADAADSAANATWLFGALGSLIGVLTLAAAFTASRWAKEAAKAARESLAAFQLVEDDKLLVELTDFRYFAGGSVKFTVVVHNLGRSSALFMKYHSGWQANFIYGDDTTVLRGYARQQVIPVGGTIILEKVSKSASWIIEHPVMRGNLTFESTIQGPQTLDFGFHVSATKDKLYGVTHEDLRHLGWPLNVYSARPKQEKATNHGWIPRWLGWASVRNLLQSIHRKQ
jgi:hypothetical protein